jgi:hypothetical protein
LHNINVSYRSESHAQISGAVPRGICDMKYAAYAADKGVPLGLVVQMLRMMPTTMAIIAATS